MNKKPAYIKCPRCELNYIKNTEKYCPVCLAEMKLAGENNDVDEDFELCPVCSQNFITSEQTICDDCAKRKSLDELVDEDMDDEEEAIQRDESEWKEESVDDVPDDDVELVSFSELEEEEDFDDEEESEEEDSDKMEDPLDADFNYDVDDEDFDSSKYDEDDDEDEEDFDDDDDDDDDDSDYVSKKTKK